MRIFGFIIGFSLVCGQAMAEDLPNSPGWVLSKIEAEKSDSEYSYGEGRVYFSLKPPDQRAAISIDARTADRLRSGEASAEIIYTGQNTAAGKKDDEFIYGKHGNGIQVPNPVNSTLTLADGRKDPVPVEETPTVLQSGSGLTLMPGGIVANSRQQAIAARSSTGASSVLDSASGLAASSSSGGGAAAAAVDVAASGAAAAAEAASAAAGGQAGVTGSSLPGTSMFKAASAGNSLFNVQSGNGQSVPASTSGIAKADSRADNNKKSKQGAAKPPSAPPPSSSASPASSSPAPRPARWELISSSQEDTRGFGTQGTCPFNFNVNASCSRGNTCTRSVCNGGMNAMGCMGGRTKSTYACR